MADTATLETHIPDHHAPHGFWRTYVFSTDHKMIGKQYLGLGLFMAVAGGLMAYLIRWQLAYPETPVPGFKWMPENVMPGGVVPDDFYNALVTLHGTTMVFFVAMPILLGAFGNFLIPLMIGTRDMAFPKLNMMSVWTFALASVVLLSSFFFEGGSAAGGWTGYPPLSADPTYTGSKLGTDLWLIAHAIEFAAFLMGGVNYLTTIFTMRAPGMSMMRMPILIWMQITAAILFMLGVGPLIAAAFMLLLDRLVGTGFFLPGKGGDPVLWQHLFWFFGHPEVYVIMLPGLGVIMEIIPVFSRKPLFSYKAIVVSTIVVGILSFIVWAHHMFISGINFRLAMPFSLTTILISVPFAVITFAIIATLWRGSITFPTPMLFALGTLVTFLIGGVTGIFLGSAALDIYFHDTYFVTAHFHYTLFPATVLGGLAGIYYWYPKMFGRRMNETIGKLHFWLTAISFNCVFIPMFFIGMGGHMRRIYNPTYYDFLKSTMPLHQFVTWAFVVLILSQLLFLVNFVVGMFRGRKAAENPWQACTLEWTAPSPPPHGNWGETLPVVHRGPYDFSSPESKADYLPQIQPVAASTPR